MPTPNPLSGKPGASLIVVRDLEAKSLVRTIQTDQLVYKLALGAGSVLYTEGAVDPMQFDTFYDTRLMLSAADDPNRRQLREGALKWASMTER
jgi:hypothetical protein